MKVKQQLKRLPVYGAIFILIFYITQILLTPGNINITLKFWDGKLILMPLLITTVLTVLIYCYVYLKYIVIFFKDIQQNKKFR